jgi:hypothetical protein
VLIEAAAARWFPDAPLPAALGLVFAWVGSTVAGALFHQYVEAPLSASVLLRPAAADPRGAVPIADDDETSPVSSAPR